jgi:hypothetical protein
MSVRLYWSPVVDDPDGGGRVLKLATLLSGKRRAQWYCERRGGELADGALAAVFAEDFGPVDADPECLRLSPDLFAGDRREVRQRMYDCWSRLREWTKTRTVGGLGLALEANWALVLLALDVAADGVTAGTSVYELLRLVLERTAAADLRRHLGE